MEATVALETTLGFLPQDTDTDTDSCAVVNGDETYSKDAEMHDDQLRDTIAREVRFAIRDQANSNSSTAGRSVDTLRRDIGIFAILLGMMVQTGAAFYWAGGVSRAQEANKETMNQIQAEQSYTRAQLQLVDGQLKLIQGKQDAESKRAR